MNTITRVVTWFHVTAFAAALFLISTMLGGGTVVIDDVTTAVTKFWPQGGACIPPLAKLAGTAVILLLGYVLAGFLLWVFLLRKQAWAWWGLTILIAVGIAEMIVGRFPTDYAWVNNLLDRFPRATLGYMHLLAGAVLIFDPPWSWRSRRYGRRRRKSGTTTSSRVKSRRRRTRRR
jgi:hypothetical protein